MWLCYGDYIYQNLQQHFKLQTKSIQCVDCGEWIEVSVKDNRTCRCAVCALEHKRELTKKRVQKHRQSTM